MHVVRMGCEDRQLQQQEATARVLTGVRGEEAAEAMHSRWTCSSSRHNCILTCRSVLCLSCC